MATRRAQQIARSTEDQLPVAQFFGSMEGLLTSEYGFGLTTATPVQRAMCWTLETGIIPDTLWAEPTVQASFGGVRPSRHRQEFVAVSGVRGAKTLIAGACCVWKALTLDLTAAAGLSLRAGELPRASIVSRYEDNATVAYQYIVGALQESPILKGIIVGEPTADTITVRHPSGIPVEIKIIAMTAAGTALVSRWCVSCIFDEAPRMASEDEGKINLNAQRSALQSRVIQGGVLMYIGSPKGDKGVVYELYKENWKNPEGKIPVVKAAGYDLNPSWWTPERCEALRLLSPDDYETDVLANFVSASSQYFSSLTIEACTRKTPHTRPYDETKKYSAAMDPASSVNSWTLVIGHTDDNRKYVIDYASEWRGTQTHPLSPKVVLSEIKSVLDAYHVVTVTSDQYAAGAIKDIAFDLGFGVSETKITATVKKALYVSLHTRATTGLLELPPLENVKRDLQNVNKVFTRGDFNFELVETADGRHADFAPAIALLCGGYIEESSVLAPVKETRVAHMTGDELEEWEDKLAASEDDWLYGDNDTEQVLESW